MVFGIGGVLAALVWAFVRVGPQTSTDVPSDVARALAWPNPGLDELQSYNRTSPLGPLLFQLLPTQSPASYLALHAAALLVALALIALWVFLAVPDAQRFRGARLVILGPVVASAFVSIGNYDPFTLLGVAALLYAWRFGRRVALVAAGILLGFQHFEQGFIAVVAMAIIVVALGRSLPPTLQGRCQPIWALIGVVGGKVLLSLVFLMQGIDPFEGRSAYITDLTILREALTTSVNHFPTLLMSMFAGLWVVMALVFFRQDRITSQLLILLALVGPFLVAVSTLAQTRVFVMVTLPLLAIVIAVALNDRVLTSTPAVILAAEAAAWLLVPQHLYVSPGAGAQIMDTNALDYVIMLVNQLTGLS